MEKQSIDQSLVGKKVIVRAKIAGVHAGTVVQADLAKGIVTLKDSRRLWRVYTRDQSGSISDVAANGLKSDAKHSIGALLPSTTIVNPEGLEVSEMTNAAWQSVASYQSV